jgi:hypothetical protein
MADTAALDCSPFTLLPHALFVKLLLLLPVDARVACGAVCKNWRSTLADRTLWTRLDLSPASGGVAEERVTDAFLRGAAAKALGGLRALDVSACAQLTHNTLLEVVTANAGALTKLRACRDWMHTPSEQVEALLGAAPRLRLCHAETHAAPEVACRMLRNEPPFGPLRLYLLAVMPPWLGGEADVRALAAAVTASASSLSELMLFGAPLLGHGALDVIVDAALARRLRYLALGVSPLSAACAPALARLLGGSWLNTLVLQHAGEEPLLLSGDGGSALLLAAALRANSTLTVLGLVHARVWHDAAAAEMLLSALTGHPSLQRLHLDGSAVRAADRARAGASLGALVAANAPTLEVLMVIQCALGDEGLGPLVDALPANTHLRELGFSDNAMSDAFARERLTPALLANTSLRKLSLVGDDADADADADAPGLRRLEQLVAERAAARGAE